MPLSLLMTAVILAIIYFFISIIKPAPPRKPTANATSTG